MIRVNYIEKNNGNIEISRTDFDDLLKDQKMLLALENAGVDNWSGYDFARELFEEDNDD